MKLIDVYYKGVFVHSINCDEIKPSDENKCWLIFNDKVFIASIPMDYVVVKNEDIVI